MTVAGPVFVATVLATLAGWLMWSPPRSVARSRLASVSRPPAYRQEPGDTSVMRFRWVASASTAVAAWLLLGGALGLLVAGVVLFALPQWLARLEPRASRTERLKREAELPLLIDVIAACLSCGAPPIASVETVAQAATSSIGSDLQRSVRALATGASVAEAWRDLPPDLQSLGVVLDRSTKSGAAAAPLLQSLAEQLRADRRARRLEAARKLGVHAAAPLGLCFLPGFIVLGLIPVMVGLATTVL